MVGWSSWYQLFKSTFTILIFFFFLHGTFINDGQLDKKQNNHHRKKNNHHLFRQVFLPGCQNLIHNPPLCNVVILSVIRKYGAKNQCEHRMQKTVTAFQLKGYNVLFYKIISIDTCDINGYISHYKDQNRQLSDIEKRRTNE